MANVIQHLTVNICCVMNMLDQMKVLQWNGNVKLCKDWECSRDCPSLMYNQNLGKFPKISLGPNKNKEREK